MKSEIKSSENYLYEYDQILWEMSNKMFSRKVSNNITVDFIRCVLPLQKASIYICENLLKYTDNYPLGQMAYNMINECKDNIKQMKGILKSVKGFNNLSYDNNMYVSDYLNITRQTIYEMTNSLRSIDINMNFVSEVLALNNGMVRLCENVLKYDIDPRLRHLVVNMERMAEYEINVLESLNYYNYGV